jgi:UDP-N-acetylglucosamine--N-acetylmuramyl-(pentapeptide) pyrophosphoryl-undecaprenol N-acetylglucosamine transferase
MEGPIRIAIAGGGTGGHVFPALGIADAVRKVYPDAAFLFFGTKDKIEATVVPQRGFPFRSIWISGLHRSIRPVNLLFPVKLLVSLVQALSSLRSFRPDVVVGTGGYVCGPVLFVASALGLPTVLHESNSYPGITTRLLAGRVDCVLTGFEETRQWLPKDTHIEVLGTPVRSFDGSPSREAARKQMGFSADDYIVLILGGSQGASSINKAIDEGMTVLTHAKTKLIWQTGRSLMRDHKATHGRKGNAHIVGFIDDMGSAYAAADVIVSRAGASTLAELALLKKPSILVPYPYAAEDHQMMNARAVEKQGGAVVVPDADVGHRLLQEIRKLQDDPGLRERMGHAVHALAHPDAADTIAQKILTYGKRS